MAWAVVKGKKKAEVVARKIKRKTGLIGLIQASPIQAGMFTVETNQLTQEALTALVEED